MTEHSEISVSEKQQKVKLAFGVEPAKARFRLRLARYKALAEAVAGYVREKNDEKEQFDLLDIGLGSGRSMYFIEAEGTANRINFHGLDNSTIRLNTVYKSEKWQLTQADIEKKTPYESGQFDIILCEQVLEHLKDPATAINEITRVLRPDGLLILGVPIFPPIINNLRKLFELLPGRSKDASHSHLHFFNSMTIKSLVRANNQLSIQKSYGFRIISGGIFNPLEDYFWWYKFNRRLGSVVPFLCTEIQILARKKSNLM